MGCIIESKDLSEAEFFPGKCGQPRALSFLISQCFLQRSGPGGKVEMDIK